MRKLLFLCALAVLPVVAAPCVPATADVFEGSGSPCTVGTGVNQFTLFDVTWAGNLAGDNEVLLTPLLASNGRFLGLSYERADGANFTAAAGEVKTATLRWIIDPPPPILDGFGLSLDPTGLARIDATVLYGYKAVDETVPPNLLSARLSVWNEDPTKNPPTDLFNEIKFQQLSNYVEVTMRITLGDGMNPAVMGNGGGRVTTTVSLTPVPEPGAAALAGGGLLALVIAARRRRQRK